MDRKLPWRLYVLVWIYLRVPNGLRRWMKGYVESKLFPKQSGEGDKAMVRSNAKEAMWQAAIDYWGRQGWSIERNKDRPGPRADFWWARRSDQETRLLWGKYSGAAPYFFSVDTDTWLWTLADNHQAGGVLFMLERDGYALVPFGRLLELLSGASRKKSTKEVRFQMNTSGDKLTIVKTGEDITQYFTPHPGFPDLS